MRKAVIELLLLSLGTLEISSATLEKVASLPIGRTLAITTWRDYAFISSGGIVRKVKFEQMNGKPEAECIIGNVVLDMLPHNGHLFVANARGGLRILDCRSLVLLGELDTDGTAFDLALRSRFLFVAEGERGIKVVDISEVSRPRLLADCPTLGTARSISLKGRYAFVADGSAGVTVLDISEPRRPKLISNYNTRGYTYTCSILGKYAFLADGTKLRVIDISKVNRLREVCSYKPLPPDYLPAFPRVLSDVTPVSTVDVWGSGGYLFVANTDFFTVLNVSNARKPIQLYTQPLKCVRLYADKDSKLLFVNGAEYGYWVFDISQPAQPDPVFATPWGRNSAIASKDSIVYINGDCSLSKVDTTIYPPRVLKTLPTKDYIMQLSLKDGKLYCSNAKEGLRIISPETLEVERTYRSEGCLYEVAIEPPYAYLALGNQGIEIVRLRDLKNISRVRTRGVARSLSLSSNHLFVADDGFGITVIDISNPASPKVASAYTASKKVNCISTNGSLVYISLYGRLKHPYWGYGTGTRGALEILDFSDIHSPKKLSYYPIPPIARHMYYWPRIYEIKIADEKCFLACGEGGFVALDVSKPQTPRLISQYGTCFPLSFDIDGDSLYLANGDNGWEVAKISDLGAPKGLLHADWKSTGLGKTVALHDHFAFLSTLGGGIHIVDISKPHLPRYTHTLRYNAGIYTKLRNGYLFSVQPTGHGNIYIHEISTLPETRPIGFWVGMGRPQDICVTGNTLFVSAYRNQTQVVDVSNPSSPKTISQFGGGIEIVVEGGRAYTGWGGDIGIWDVSSPSKPRHLGSWNVTTIPGATIREIVVKDGLAYVAGGIFYILDVSKPKNVRFVGKCDQVSRAYTLALSNKYAFVCELFKGVSILDITDPARPTRVGFYASEGGSPWDLNYRDGLLYVADGEAGLSILKLSSKGADSAKTRHTLPVGFRLYPPRGVAPKWYYNELIGKPFGYLEAMGEYARRCAITPIVGVFDDSLSPNYIPFYAESNYTELIGCGFNPLQSRTGHAVSEGKVIRIGSR